MSNRVLGDPIDNIVLNYQEGTLSINGNLIKELTMVTINQPDGWPKRKLFNYKDHVICKDIPEISITVKGFEGKYTASSLKID